jgi:drug/metabolite transporter (DMT)-like permease
MASNPKDLKPEYGLGNTLMMIVMVGAVWAGVALLIGALQISGGALFTVTDGSGSYNPAFGVVYIVSGALAVLCIIRIYTQQKYQQAFLFCLIGSAIMLVFGIFLVAYYITVKDISVEQALIAPVIELVSGVVGLIFAFMMRREQFRFKS